MPVIKGFKAELYMDGTKIGKAESVTIDIDMGLEEYYEVGSPWPILVQGPQVITGTIDKLWIDTDMLEMAVGTTKDLVETTFNITVWHKDTKEPNIHLYFCRVETLSFDIPADGFVTESLDFRAEYALRS